jgi:Zn-dependent protease
MDTNFFSSFSVHSQQALLAAINEAAIFLPVLVILFTWRGFCQALIAKWMGDSTPEDDGFLTINPLAHVDVMGLLIILGIFLGASIFLSSAIPRSILLMILIMLGIRWSYRVTIDDTQFKNYRLGGIVTSLSGPLANFLLAFVMIGASSLILSDQIPHNVLVSLLVIMRSLSSLAIFFGVIDLVPIPPFDGGRLLRYIFPRNLQYIVDWLEEHAFIIVLVLFFAPFISNIFLGGMQQLAFIIHKLMVNVFF